MNKGPTGGGGGIHLSLYVEVHLLDSAAVDHHGHVGDGHAGLGHVGSHDDLQLDASPSQLKHTPLLLRGEVAWRGK